MDNRFWVSPIFSDGMVLQRDKEIIVDGLETPLQTVTIEFMGDIYSTQTDHQGKWLIKIPAKKAGGPYKMRIIASDIIEINNCLIGDVWLLSGQSNMELPISRVKYEYPEEFQTDKTEELNIRQFRPNMDILFSDDNNSYTEGIWQTPTEKYYDQFSALGYFYAKKINQILGIPIGLILTAVGGSPIESWIDEKLLLDDPQLKIEIDYWNNEENRVKEFSNNQNEIRKWHEDINLKDKGLKENWHNTLKSNSNWQAIELPNMFKVGQLNEVSGVVWFKKIFQLTKKDLESQYFRLRLGTLINADITFMNGVEIGQTGYRYPPRRYKFDKEILKVGDNEVTVRLVVEKGDGGFIPDFPYQLEMSHRNLDLSGNWLFQISYQTHNAPTMLFQHQLPGTLFRTGIKPLKNIKLTGILFYQGESNTSRPSSYANLMEKMVDNWRNLFAEELPFYHVQLANYLEPTNDVDDMQWAELRHQQFLFNNLSKNVGMVSAIDLGQWNELHPLNKKTLGERLAKLALAKHYMDFNFSYENPEFDYFEYSSNKLIIQVKNLEGKIVSIDDKPPLIEVQYDDGDWKMSAVDIKEKCLIINLIPNSGVKAVRYAWRNNPIGLLRDNISNLPLLPFRVEKE